MNLIYAGKYKKRFEDVISHISLSDKQVLELCFGDIVVGTHCKANFKNWMGYDLNPKFVEYAVRNGLNAKRVDILGESSLPKNDLTIMIGSLYHFYPNCENLLSMIMLSTKRLILSEPVENLSSSGGLLGLLAKRSANAGHGDEVFRFNKDSLKNTIHTFSTKYSFSYKIHSVKRDMVMEIIKND